jgi:hypothetical protein
MRPTADFVVRSVDGMPKLAVEVKAIKNANPGWAAAFRRNLFDHAAIPLTPYFLVALSDRFYLWKDAPREAVPPLIDVPAKDVLAAQLNGFKIPLDELSAEGLKNLVSYWLYAVITGNEASWARTPATVKLIEAGLYEAIKGGFIDSPVHA